MSIYRWVDKHTLVYLYSGELGGKNSDRNEPLTLLHRWITESKSVVAQSSGAKEIWSEGNVYLSSTVYLDYDGGSTRCES